MKAIRSRRSAFTLIELLVVISIIAVLASLTFAGVQSALIAAKKVSAKNDMAQIANGVQFYYTEYGKYPTAGSTGTNDLVFGTSDSGAQANSSIINVLRYPKTGWTDTNNENPRQIQFLQPKTVDAKKGGVNWSSTGSGDGNWYDPWGTQYVIFIDAAYDGDITVKDRFTDITTNPAYGVGVASVGYYYAKKNTTKTVADGGLNFGSNKLTILLSW
ncbi:MAG: type II secretion system protein [Chthoniobacteraceae bacterium]|nr:type II secretion system protein [Chthoniobacteraceae bacterium]